MQHEVDDLEWDEFREFNWYAIVEKLIHYLHSKFSSMKPKLSLIVLLILCVITTVSAQDFKAKFKEIFPKGNADATLALLKQWRKAVPNDPEFYVYAYNFYAQEGLKPILSLTNDKKNNNGFEIKDKNNKVAGYLGESKSYNETLINKGFNYIDTGISKFPNRLDMRFGKVYVLGRIKNYKLFTQEIITAINYGETINYKWAWTDGKRLEDPQDFMLATVQQYVSQMFNEGDQYMADIKSIAETVLKYHPDHVESLSDVAVYYIVNKDYKNALPLLLKAEKIKPQDDIVLNNIAYSYSLLGDKSNAIRYYELVVKYGDAENKKIATEKIAELKK
ncbi:tetratricopeptide repeat protein [Mucilaginibacter lutimaris]|uniref:Tetratricopeptide repeat protein n=1 Tax=Mucilaginibacter lutimaris TaxID=931629 RepID=A0ABW2ZC76_9SPHI